MSILARLFGEVGTVRFEGITTEGVSFSGKMKIESFNYSLEEIEGKLKDIFYVMERANDYFTLLINFP